MAASKCCRRLWLAAWGLLFLPSATHAESLPQTRTQSELTWLLESGDVLARRGSATASEVPPWEGLASRRSGRDNWLRVALATQASGFLPRITTSAALRAELDLSGVGQGGAAFLRDASSSLAVSWWASHAATLTLRAFPFDSDYLRLGYLHALDWGGSDVARRESVFGAHDGGAPAVTLAWQAPRVRLFLGLKWAKARDVIRGEQRLWGSFAGGSFDLARALRFDAGFGYFERLAHTDGAPSSFVEGASLRAVWHRGPSEPELSSEPFRPPSLREEPARIDAAKAPGFALSLEAVTLVTRQRRFEAPNENTLTAAPAVALYGSVRRGRGALHLALVWRSLAFVIRDDPRLASNEALPARSLALAELSGWLGGSWDLPWRLTAGGEAGVRVPAALQSPSQLSGYAQTLVVGGPAGFEGLPPGSGRLPVVAGRLSLRWALSEPLAVAVLGDYVRNPNRTALATSPGGVTRSFVEPQSAWVLGAVQARF